MMAAVSGSGAYADYLSIRSQMRLDARLADADWITGDVRDQLTEIYRSHRDVEHRLQMVNDAQTHSLPQSADGMDRLARLSGEGDTGAFRDRITELFGDY